MRFSTPFYVTCIVLLALGNGIKQANPTITFQAFLGGTCAGPIGGLVAWGILRLFSQRKPTILQCMFWVSAWFLVVPDNGRLISR